MGADCRSGHLGCERKHRFPLCGCPIKPGVTSISGPVVASGGEGMTVLTILVFGGH